MPMVDVNGLATHYTLDGPKDAPVLTFVPGQSFTLETWARQVPAFSDRFRVLCLDLRGHGGTALGDIKEAVACADSWKTSYQFDCPVTSGSQTDHSRMIGEAQHVVSL